MIKQGQRTSVERVQFSSSPQRSLFNGPCSTSSLYRTSSTPNKPIISGFRLCGGSGAAEVRLFMCARIDARPLRTQKSDSGEIKRKSKPARVRTGCFQHRGPQHQLAGCAAAGSSWSWSGPAGGSKHTSSPGLYEIRRRATMCRHGTSYTSSPVPGLQHTWATISYLRL